MIALIALIFNHSKQAALITWCSTIYDVDTMGPLSSLWMKCLSATIQINAIEQYLARQRCDKREKIVSFIKNGFMKRKDEKKPDKQREEGIF